MHVKRNAGEQKYRGKSALAGASASAARLESLSALLARALSASCKRVELWIDEEERTVGVRRL